MSSSSLVLLISQLLPLISNLALEILKLKDIPKEDKEALLKSVREMREKVAGIKWE